MFFNLQVLVNASSGLRIAPSLNVISATNPARSQGCGVGVLVGIADAVGVGVFVLGIVIAVALASDVVELGVCVS
jgi:hypothetical protein